MVRFPKSIAVACILAVATGWALFAWREHLRNTRDIVARGHWPSELVHLIKESTTRGDFIENVDVRHADLFTTYVWKMPATQSRLDLHLEHFELAAAPRHGIEHERIVFHWPYAWSLPTSDFDMYAHPIGLPGADDGEFEFVLLHDKGTSTIYFYYYFNF